jgi:uncharacterized protein YndB with AHSA1/START domain
MMATVAITPDQDAVVAEIFVAAPPARVFEAITDPKQVPQWWGQQGMYRITEWKGDLRTGGKWSSVGTGADGTSFRVDGEYLEVDPPRLLVHTWIASWTSNLKTVVRWELEPRDVHGLQHSGPKKSGTGTLVRPASPRICGRSEICVRPQPGMDSRACVDAGFVEAGATADSRG